jgi:hypothetical protein
MIRLSLLAGLLGLTLAACGGIRVVDKTPSGGTVALEGSYDTAREKAEEFMRSECPQGYRILDEDRSIAQRIEWRLRYECKPMGGQQAAARELVVRF